MVTSAATMVDKMVVEVIVTIIAIDAAIEIRRLTRTLLVIFVNVFLLVTFVAISLVVLMTTPNRVTEHVRSLQDKREQCASEVAVAVTGRASAFDRTCCT
jgi:uncharacterized membrane protein